jgi:gamma-glutamyltranspeptidase / glutathione hydrolase
MAGALARSLALVAGPALLAFGFVGRNADAAYPQSAEGSRVAVVTDHVDATRAALDVLSSGGNAADAAVAAALVLGVVAPSGSGLGGGGFALSMTARDHKVTALDFRETAPTALDTARLLAGRGTPGRGATIGVPGEAAGLEWLVTHHGKRPLARDADAAVRAAEAGFYVSRPLADALSRSGARMAPGSELAIGLFPGFQPAPYATRITRPELAATLKRFGAEGSRAIYTGSVADRIVESTKAAGGSLTLDDLREYRVRERKPLQRDVDGKTIVTMPAPSAGGLMVLETLGMHGASGASPLYAMGFGSSTYLHVLAETFRGAMADRVRLAGDPDLESGVAEAYDRALDPAQLAARRQRIDVDKTKPATEFRTREAGTSHIVVVDQEGNVVALTTTVNDAFGSGVVARGTGIVLNDELEDFASPADVAGFGLVGLGPNRPRPKARPVSSMTPVIVLEKGDAILVAGGSGGARIATGVTQALLARLVFGLDPSACVSSPRVHPSGAQLLVEAEVPFDVRWGLQARGEQLSLVPSASDPASRAPGASGPAAVQMITIERDAQGRHLLAGTDPRKGGMAAAR